ncbi:MAG: hypothetical protein HRF50_04475 [Phycisphaerae bacterium]
MTDRLDEGLSWLAEQRQQHMTRTVTYVRGAESITLSATVGRTAEITTDPLRGSVHRVRMRDYLVRAADLVLGGESTLPLPGDVVRETDGSTTYEYVVAPLPDEPCFRYSDAARRTLRIHTKHKQTTG